MTHPVGIALIGTGMWGRRLAGVIQRVPSLRLVTCFTRDETKRTAFASEFGCEAASTFESAIEHPAVRGVLLVTPNHVHAEQTLACAERGRHVFVEKPIAYTVEEARTMQSACQRAGVTLFVGHSFRRLGAARKVKAFIDEGILGKILLAEANFSLPGNLTPDKWRYYRETCPGGPLMQLGIHHADTLQYWLGPVAAVQGSFARLVTDAEIDDVGVAQLEFASGARGVLTSSYVSPKTYSLRMYGTKANLDYVTDMSIWPDAARMDSATRIILRSNAQSEVQPFKPEDMLVEELDEFARCVRGEAVPETGAEEAIAALQVILGALRSSETGIRVAL
ncbi:MAG TPA: Gfo/Idh/MocA family oxidoreductase [Anaerolineales bacterium]|nr:Gfo/Idh/MocA family oxidoreductase [Anaerolineales bacterium]